MRLLVASALGAIVGFERQQAEKPAAIRTYTLVALGAAAFTVASLSGFPGEDSPSRVAAQIVSGIGFLGAGLIIRQEGHLVGVTTAAGIWVCAAIGMVAGAGMYLVAVGTAVIAYAVLRMRDLTGGD